MQLHPNEGGAGDSQAWAWESRMGEAAAPRRGP